MCIFCSSNYLTKQFSSLITEEPSNLKTENFRVFGGKWGQDQTVGSAGGTVTFSFAEENVDGQFATFDSFITRTSFKEEITESLANWENIANIRFVLTEDSPSVDIRFGWMEIDGPGGVLGQTTVPVSGRLSKVIVGLDVEEDWFLNGDAPPNKIDFSSTVTHEVGHAIGIDHSQSSNALMNASYSTNIFELREDDINAAVHIYGDNDIVRIEVHRFFNSKIGSHLFTADLFESDAIGQSESFNIEGIGFEAIAATDESLQETVPVYRFLIPKRADIFSPQARWKEVLYPLSMTLFRRVLGFEPSILIRPRQFPYTDFLIQ